MKKVFDLCVKTGTYEKDGATKNNWLNVGVVLEDDKGMFILLKKHFNPAGIQSDKDTVLISMFSKKEKTAENNIVEPEDIAWQE